MIATSSRTLGSAGVPQSPSRCPTPPGDLFPGSCLSGTGDKTRIAQDGRRVSFATTRIGHPPADSACRPQTGTPGRSADLLARQLIRPAQGGPINAVCLPFPLDGCRVRFPGGGFTIWQHPSVRDFLSRFFPVMETQIKTASDRPCGALVSSSRPRQTDEDHDEIMARRGEFQGKWTMESRRTWGMAGTVNRWCRDKRRTLRFFMRRRSPKTPNSPTGVFFGR